MFVKSGAWDLLMYSIRKIVHDKTSGFKLIEAFQDLFSGAMPCDKLTHIVWVTSGKYYI